MFGEPNGKILSTARKRIANNRFLCWLYKIPEIMGNFQTQWFIACNSVGRQCGSGNIQPLLSMRNLCQHHYWLFQVCIASMKLFENGGGLAKDGRWESRNNSQKWSSEATYKIAGGFGSHHWMITVCANIGSQARLKCCHTEDDGNLSTTPDLRSRVTPI